MNAFSKYVLMPYDEYVRKIVVGSPLNPILQSNQPTIVKNNELLKHYHIPQREGWAQDQGVGHGFEHDFQPMAHSTPSKIDYSAGSSTLKPQNDTFDSITNSKDEVIDSDGTIVPNSNINEIKKFLQSDQQRGPPGTKETIKSLVKKPEKHAKVTNKRAKKALKTLLDENIKQSGGGSLKLWKSLKMF